MALHVDLHQQGLGVSSSGNGGGGSWSSLDNHSDQTRLAKFLGTEVVHLLIVGETGAGKTTLARQIAHDRHTKLGSDIIILDPHAVQPTDGSPGDWGELVAIGAGRNFAAIEEKMMDLVTELNLRYEHRRDGQVEFTDTTIFIDEWPSIKTWCKKIAPEFMKTFAHEGRKVGMRLVILSHSRLVETLGIKGESDTLTNFTVMYAGGMARAQGGVLVQGYEYPIVVEYQKRRFVFDLPLVNSVIEQARKRGGAK